MKSESFFFTPRQRAPKQTERAEKLHAVKSTSPSSAPELQWMLLLTVSSFSCAQYRAKIP
jgi:hypothetical protein